MLGGRGDFVNSDNFEIQTILIAADPRGQASKMAHLHRKRLNFIQKGKNESRYPEADMKKSIFCMRKYQKVSLFFLFWTMSESYF